MTIVLPKALPQQPGLWSVPFEKNPNFVGRESLILAIDEILSSSESCQRIALWGLDGIGKTQIVLEYAHRRKKAAPGCAVFWLSTFSVATFEESYLEIGKLLRIPGLDDVKADIKTLIQDKLNDERTGEWLIIVDNVDDADVLSKETRLSTSQLIKFLPSSPKGSIIFTTRTRETAVELANIQNNRIKVAKMSKEEARDLWKNTIGKSTVDQEPEAIDELLDLLAQVPLAIIQAASFVARTTVQLSEYISMFQNSETDTIKILSQNFEDANRYRELKNPVATTWLISFEHIRKENPLAANYLMFMACLFHENIPQSLLPEEESALNKTQAIETLIEYSFLIRKQSAQMFDMHRLVHLAMRSWLKDQNQLASRTNSALFRVVEELPHGIYHSTYISASSLEFIRWELREILLDSTWKYQYSLGQYRASEEILKQLLHIREINLGADDSRTMTTTNYIGMTLTNQGKYAEAERTHRKALALKGKILGKEDWDVLASMTNLSRALARQGKHIEGEEIQKEAVALGEKVLGKEHPITLQCTNILGMLLNDQGKYLESEKICREALALGEKFLGKEHSTTIQCRYNLSWAFHHQKKYEEADKILRENLALEENSLGKEHPTTLQTAQNLARNLSYQEKYAEAEKMLKELIPLSEKVFEKEHSHTLRNIYTYTQSINEQGRYKEAEEMFRELIPLQEKVLGKEHSETLLSISNLATNLSQQGYYAEAEEMFRDLISLQEKVLGKESPDTLLSRDWLEHVLDKLKKNT